MKIPSKPKDMTFLQGKWRCSDPRLWGVNERNEKVRIEYEFSFDGRGGGTATVLEATGGRCIGAARGSLVNDGLHIEVERQVCSDGKRGYNAEIVDCRNQGATALCQADGSGGEWGCEFTKLE